MRRTFAGPGQSTGTYKATLDPGKSMPSSASGSPGDFYSKSQKDVVGEVAKGAPLKPTTTVDKSKPAISSDVHVKKVDRKPFLNEVQKDHELHHVESTADRSDPTDTHIKTQDRKAFLSAVEEKAKEKGTADQE